MKVDRRTNVLLAVVGVAVMSFAVACGGKDKPPLTPDSDNPVVADDAGVDMPAAPSPPTAPAPAK